MHDQRNMKHDGNGATHRAFPLIAIAGALGLQPCVHASFTGFAVNESQVGDVCLADLYATFTTSVDVMLNMFSVNLTIGGGFESLLHDDLLGGTWAPQFVANADADSFLLNGGVPGFGNSTSADPNWGPDGFDQLGIPLNAGWFNSNPPNLQGKAKVVTLHNWWGGVTYDGAATWVGRFAFNNPGPQGKHLFIDSWLTWNQGLSDPTPSQQLQKQFETTLFAIPAPSVLPMLLGLVGVAVGGRRRRG